MDRILAGSGPRCCFASSISATQSGGAPRCPLPWRGTASPGYSAAVSGSYDQAVAALYQAPHESFVAERKRLAAELKAGGDKEAAAAFARLARPTLSAWAVNQLWWHARDAFDELFQTAERLRQGELTASSAHRKAVSKLTASAQQLLSASGHGTGDATLRRVTMTLTGLAASGSFAPEPPGALTKDRDPPGFEAFGIGSLESKASPAALAKSAPQAAVRQGNAADKHAADKHAADKHAADKHAAAEAKRRAAEARVKAAAERARREAKRRELERSVREAKAELAAQEGARDRLADELVAVERLAAHARAALERAAQALAALED